MSDLRVIQEFLENMIADRLYRIKIALAGMDHLKVSLSHVIAVLKLLKRLVWYQIYVFNLIQKLRKRRSYFLDFLGSN